MSRRGFRATLVRVIVIIVLVTALKYVFEKYLLYTPLVPEGFRKLYSEYVVLIDIALIIAVGLFTVRVFTALVKSLSKHFSKDLQHTLVNITRIVGYVALILAILARIGVGPETLIASATFSGLILGLGLTPILSNFFSGLIILGTGYIKPGRYIKISTSSIPSAVLAFPAYKMFSRDMTIPYIRGVVLEIGLLYTKIVSIDGELLKVPNSIILNSSVVAEDYEESKRVQVRYEFPVTCDPSLVLGKIRDRVSRIVGSGSLEVYVEEQSDKNYFIVLVVATSPPEVKVREFRSQLLQEILSVHRELLLSKSCTQQA